MAVKFGMSPNGIAEVILKRNTGRISGETEENIRRVSDFADQLRGSIKGLNHSSELRGTTVFFGGSSAEGLAVSSKTDFDISLILGDPYSQDNFIVHRKNEFFALEWLTHAQNKKYHDSQNFLRAQDLRKKVFQELRTIIKQIKILGANIKCNEGLAALIVKMEFGDDVVSLDLVPHIAFYSWGQCPDLKPLGELPKTFQDFIRKARVEAIPPFLFCLAAPRRPTGTDTQQLQLCNISFAPLEKEFFKTEKMINDMTCLVKLVAQKNEWKQKYRFQSYLVKRVAIKYASSLRSLDLLEGYKRLLDYTRKELGSGTIDGYFIENQKTYLGQASDAQELQKEIGKLHQMGVRDTASSAGYEEIAKEIKDKEDDFWLGVMESWKENMLD